MLLVGRGGQGVVLASQILADTFARAGYWVQSFPEFKAERRGAPISAFLRWDEDGPIHRRYKVRDCDVLVGIATSTPSPETLALVRPGGLVVLDRETRFPAAGPFTIARVPASSIARRNQVLSSEGRPMGNVTVLGACVRLLVPGGLEFLEQAIRSRMGALAEANVAAAAEGYDLCTRQRAVAGDTPFEPVLDLARTRGRGTRRAAFPTSTASAPLNQTGTWSLDRPVLTDACTACGVCALFCPEGVITRNGGSMAVDYLYCKGCGICEVVCPVRKAIHMEEVRA
jgi:2-oxoacid:acceptor oxidoreductase gamma subunit (pyruvate/2-ketoisovalerate family)/2-oxoacid:acceptor oxidoreductase delta subunit (pyruvate/2-ketoisovalerate family)